MQKYLDPNKRLPDLVGLDDLLSFDDFFSELDTRYPDDTNYNNQFDKPKRVRIDDDKLMRYYNKQTQDNRSLEQILNEMIEDNFRLTREVNQMKIDMKIVKDRMLILYKKLKEYGASIELFD